MSTLLLPSAFERPLVEKVVRFIWIGIFHDLSQSLTVQSADEVNKDLLSGLQEQAI